MTNKENSPKAYIDGKSIKIVDAEGNCFEDVISNTVTARNRMKNIIMIAASVFAIAAFVMIGNTFGGYLNKSTESLFTAMLIISAIAALFSYIEITEQVKKYDIWTAKFNLSKHMLQDDVLKLENILAQHIQQLNQTNLTNSMDFSQNFKKKEKPVPYLQA